MEFKILGKTIKTSAEKLSKKLKVSISDVEEIQSNSIRYLQNKKTGEVAKIDLKNSPLLIREFGVKSINNKIIKGGEIKKGILVNKEYINIIDGRLTGKITGLLDVVWLSSGNPWRDRFVFIDIDKSILKDQDEIKKKLEDKFLFDNPQVAGDVYARLAEVQNIRIVEFIDKNGVKLKYDNMKLRSNKVLDIRPIFGENIDLNKSKNNSCVKDYLLKNYPISPKKINKLGDENGITPFEIYDFCKEYNIKMILFNIEGDIIMSNYPVKVNKTYKKLIGLVYNNHFYPLKNEELHRIPQKKIKNNVYCDDLKSKLIEILNTGIYPNDVSIYNNEISSIQIDDTIYHKNQDYKFCLDVLNKFGLKDKMDFFINKINVAGVIEKLFIKSNIESFFPYNSNEGGFTFFDETFIDDDVITIDHNKHYSDSLRKLNNLIVIDIKTCKHVENPELVEGFFYIAKPKYSSILMPKTGFYSYEFLVYCKKEGVEFTLKESVSCEYKPNYYQDMINTLYEKLSNEEFKNVVNCMIGKFEKKGDIKQVLKYKKIVNQDEKERSEGYNMKINDDFDIMYDMEEVKNTKIFNRVPIRVQVLCEARKIVYEKMKAEGITQVKQIRCDAITFKPKRKFRGGYEMGEWKQQDATYYNKATDIYDNDMTFKLKPINQNNKIYIDYAGSGKTHFIINKLIVDMEDFIVLSPSHASIREYRSRKINCNVIQKYLLGGIMPEEKNIIVDEVGMLDSGANNFLIKCSLLGKNIYSFGDFEQLKPVNGEPCNSNIYLNYMYASIDKLGTNYRNKFTFDYYDTLINMKDILKMVDEIKKYNVVNYFDAETIITYRNETRVKYNNLMCEKLGVMFGDVGCKIVCKTNELKDKNIYNNFYYHVKKVDGEDIIISDGIDDIEINMYQLEKNFDLGYCRTLYNIQGESIKSFYFAMEDINFINGRSLYTLISRLKA
jgi:hypothetical protein